MKIGEVARRTKLRSSAIRYYERLGLLPNPTRVSGRREYDASVIDALRFIAAAQKAGFTLAEIRTLRAAGASGRNPRALWSEMAAAKLEAIERSIQELTNARHILVDAKDCACEGWSDACKLVTNG